MKHSRLGILAAIVLFSMLVSACGSPAQPAPANSQSGSSSGSNSSTSNLVTASSPPYAKLAALDAGSPNPPPSLIQKFETLLSSLSKKCPTDTQQLLSDYIVKSQELLKEKGVNLSLLEIADHVDNSMPGKAELGKCAQVFAAFVTLTSK
jgi:hypothetical protein